jgi:hypothetical protein
MANGDLARALAYQSNLQSDTRALFRQWMNSVTQSNERDKQRLYEETVRGEERNIAAGVREENKRQSLAEWNRNETRYQDKLRTEREERNEERDRIIISRGFDMDLDRKNEYYGHLVKSGRMKSVFGYDLLEGEMSRSRSELDRSSMLTQGLDSYNLDTFEYNQIENMYKSGKFEKGFETLNNVLDRKVDPKNYPEINASLKNISSQIDTNSKALIDPYNILTEDQERTIRNEIGALQSELSTILAPLSRKKLGGGGGGSVDSTDYGLFQINDKVWDKTSQEFFGKNSQRLTPEENINFASWIVKNSPRTVGKSTSGWNNWSVVLNGSYKKHLNKSDSYYMAGGLSESNLRLIEQQFGDDAQMAKAVMFAESGGKHSATNQNLAGGGSRGGSKKKPFSPEWNANATSYLSSVTGLSPEQFNKAYGKDLIQWMGRINREGISNERANAELEKFANSLKTTQVKLRVPFGKHSGKKLNPSIVNDLLKERNKARAQKTAVTGRPIFTSGTTHGWLDTFAKELGFSSAEELSSKEGAMAIRDYYSGNKSKANQIDFTKPFTLTR